MSILRKKHYKNRKKRIGLKILAVLAVFFVLISIGVIGLLAGLGITATNIVLSIFGDLPDIRDFNPVESALTSKIYADDGTLIATFHGEQNRELVDLEQMPKNLKNAIISIEDERFYEHDGFDLEGILRAFLINLQAGGIVEGASTLTMQYISEAYLPEAKTSLEYESKLQEAALAYQLEQIYEKDEILEMYLNTTYFGEGAYGVQAAARVYFDKDVEYLNLSECAMIAGLPQIPNLNPYMDMKTSLARRNAVLGNMLRLEYISQEEYEKAINSPIITQRPSEEITEEIFAPYFVEHVKQELIDRYGVNRVFEGGFEIYTTLDPDMQIAAEEAIAEILYDPEDPAAALVAMDVSNGYIKAMVGGKDFTEMKFNLATQSKRQPGSTFKVFALLAALEQGISPHMTFNPNGTVYFDIVGSEPWEVSNYMGEEYETNEMDIISATISSINVVYSQLIMRVGGYAVSKLANDMGIETPLEGYPAIGLGGLTTGVSPLEVCTAFSTLADYGQKKDPVAILKVVDKNGNTLEEYDEQEVEKEQVISSINAFRAIEIMQQVMLRGTGTRARLEDRPCAGKTGTTQEAENAWFTGFTTDLAACVWMGYPEVNVKMGVIHDMRVQGGAHPAMIWNLFMTEATKDMPIEEFGRPDDTAIQVQVTTNPETGEVMIPNRYTPSDQISLANYTYGAEPRNQVPISLEAVPLMPMVSLMPIDEANHILLEAGFTHIEYKNG